MKKLLFMLLATVLLLAGCQKEDAFVVGENDIIINAGTEWELPGILTLPEGKGPFPLVVIVHRFGPAEKDSYRDVTELFAKHGIASIRNEKRTTAYPAIMHNVNFTLKEESVDDALSTVALAKTIKKIAPHMIFVLGHSQGGFLLPKIYEEDSKNTVAGFISLAGPAKPRLDGMKDEAERLLSNPELSEAEVNMYKSLLGLYEKIQNFTEADLGKDQMLFGYNPSYWLYLADYDPAESAKNMDKPMLFLHGSSDYDVLPDNLDIWKLATQNNPKAAYKLYPGLNHDFGFYSEDGEEVIIDIANFIKNQYK